MRVAIAGYGIEGKVNYEYWQSRGDDVTIVDEREVIDAPDGARVVSGADAFSHLDGYEKIIRSPSIHPDKLPYGDAVWSATNEFFAHCPVPIIGVTGTKGKGTTCSLIASILRAAGKTVHLVGNIGIPALEVLPRVQPDDVVIYELSSFQLWDLEYSPHIAIVLMIEPDHLDVHSSLDEYIAAKAAITARQTPEDVVIYYRDNAYARSIADSSLALTRIAYPYDVSEWENELTLPGVHNRDNLAAAIAAASQYVDDEEVIRRGIVAFEGLPHRLKFVAKKSGVLYYDDSISTTPGSAIAALASFEQPKVIILGGSDKGADYTTVVDACKRSHSTVIAIGHTGKYIAELCARLGVTYVRQTGDMPAIVATADKISHVGDVVILSPASASFDRFKDYADRGDQFIAAIATLA